MKRKILIALALGSALAGAAPANATVFISYSADGGVTKTAIVSGSGNVGSIGTASNGVSYNLAGQGAPDFASPDFSTNSINASFAGSAATSLILYFTQTGDTAFNGRLLSSFTSNILTGSAQNVTVASYYSATNANGSLTGVSPGTLLQSNTFNTIGTFANTNPLTLAGPFSTTVTYTLNFGAGAGRFNTTADLAAAVPETATWGMMILGFGIVGGAMRRRVRSTKVAFA